MKKNQVIFILLASLFSKTVYGQVERTVDSEIRDITVFLARAQVTRTVKTRLEPGRTNLVVTGLASQLDPNGIQVSGRGSFTILGTSHRQNFLQDVNTPKSLRVLKDSLEFYRRQLTVEESQKEILTKEEAMLSANQRIGGTNSNLTVAELKAMADFFRARLSDIVASRMKLDGSIRKINEKMSRVQSQINTKNELYSRNSGEIVISVAADNTTPAELEVSYVVSRAGWQPVYDLRATSTKAPVQLSYKANVFQSTGEEWKNVKLTLSTANPNLGGLKPELVSQVLDFLQVMPYGEGPYKRMKSAPVAMERAADTSAPAELEEANTLADRVSTVESAVNTSFVISIPYTVTSSNQPTLVDIGRHELLAAYRYAAAPKLESDAFLMAMATGWEELSLLPGQASVFFEGTYVGKTFIDPNSIRDTLSLSLGRDKRIVLKRERVKDLTSRKFISGSIRESKAFTISVRNTRQEPITVVVEDQVPISRNTQIEVAVVDVGGASWNKETGKLTWTLTLQPSEVKNLQFKYEVKYPKDKPITGL